MKTKRKKTSDAVIAEDIKKLSDKIGRIPRQEDYKNDGNFGLSTLLLRKPWNQWLIDIFGEINNNREPRAKKILDSEFTEDVRRVATMLNKSPTQKEYDKHGLYPLSAALRRKKWNDWLISAVVSVNYNRSESSRTKRIPDQNLANDIKRIAIELGHIPTRGEYDEMGDFSSDTIVIRKPWEKFAKGACGNLPTPTHINKMKVADETLLEQLKNLKEKLNRTPLKEDLGGQNGFGYNTYVRAFGTFGNALVAADLIDPLQRYCVSRQELIDELKRVYILLGHTPSLNEFFVKSPIRSSNSICSEFGSWTKALLAADILVIKAKNVSIEDIKIALQKWYIENNNNDSCLEYWKIRKAGDKKFPYSCNTIKKKFHPLSWQEIMRECGFSNYTTRDPYIAGKKKGNHTGTDGNEYLSSLEKEVGDFLFILKNTNRIKDYEYEAEVCPDRLWTCDFKIVMPDDRIIWLEADGLRQNRRDPYNSGTNEKIKFYVDNGMGLAVISYTSSDIIKTIEEALFSSVGNE